MSTHITETPEYKAAASVLADELDERFGDDDCGGWTWDPPCGGCSACLRAQCWYGFNKEWGLIE